MASFSDYSVTGSILKSTGTKVFKDSSRGKNSSARLKAQKTTIERLAPKKTPKKQTEALNSDFYATVDSGKNNNGTRKKKSGSVSVKNKNTKAVIIAEKSEPGKQNSRKKSVTTYKKNVVKPPLSTKNNKK